MNKSIEKKPKTKFQIKDHFEDVYAIDKLLEQGGSSGFVCKAHRINEPDNYVAIKFYVQSDPNFFFQTKTLEGFVSNIDSVSYDAEFNFLRKHRHSGIQELISYGELENPSSFLKYIGIHIERKEPLRFIISTFVEGEIFNKWILNLIGKVNGSEITRSNARHLMVRNLAEISESLLYIHNECKTQHGDLALHNIIISNSTNRPIILDFGYSHCFAPETYKSSPVTQIRLINDIWPVELREEIQAFIKSNHSYEINRQQLEKMLAPGLDLYQFGLLLKEITQLPEIEKVLFSFDIEFLHLLISRTTKWKVVKSLNTHDICEQINKLAIGYWSFFAIDSFSNPQITHKRIALPQSSLILPDLVEKIIQTKAFRRLQHLHQLSLLHFVYPGATQTRFEHSLAVYSNACDLVQNLLKSPRFCLLFDSKSISQLLVIALLHDINHFPFLHYFQEMKLRGKEDVDVIDMFCDGKATGDKPSIYELLNTVDITPQMYKQIVFGKMHTITDPKLQVMKSIIDSGADIDKLSYVIDDSRMTGVPFGRGVDKFTLFAEADIVRTEIDSSPSFYHLCFKPDALSAVESLLMARYWNFKQIYWHHTNRAMEAMISHVLDKIYRSKKSSYEEYIKLTIGSSETQAISYLDDKHRSLYSTPSIVSDLASRRNNIYKRLLSIRLEYQSDGKSKELFKKIIELSPDKKSVFVKTFREIFTEKYKTLLNGFEITDEDFLIDIPGRDLGHDMGTVFVCDILPDGKPKAAIKSPFIDQLNNRFIELSQTIRFFVSPRIRDRIGKNKLEKDVPELQSILLNSLDAIKNHDYVR